MQKKDNNKLLKSYETFEKNHANTNQEVKGYWEWNKLYNNRNQRIDAWKNSR